MLLLKTEEMIIEINNTFYLITKSEENFIKVYKKSENHECVHLPIESKNIGVHFLTLVADKIDKMKENEITVIDFEELIEKAKWMVKSSASKKIINN